MAADVKFVRGSQLAYDAIATKDSGTLYFVTDANAQAFYLGDQKLSSVAEVASLITNLATTDANVTKLQNALAGINYTAAENAETVLGVINTHIQGVTDTIGDLDDLTTTSKGTIVAAVNELNTAVTNANTSKAITITSAAGAANSNILTSYTIRQGTATMENPDSNIIGVINIPKDLVVSSGSLVTITSEGGKFVDENGDEVADATAAGTFIILTFANQDERVFINVADLIDVYTAQQNATQVQLAIINNVVSATIVAGSIGTTELADGSVTTAKIADNNVTKAKLSTTLQGSIDKADSAVQSVVEGANNGTISVDGTEVSVHGLGSAAYTPSTDYDAAGSAANVLGTNADTASTLTVYGVSAKAALAEQNAKDYADGLLTWGAMSPGGGA